MSALMSPGASPVVAEMDELLEYLDGSRQRAAAAFATEMFFFARVSDLVQRREAERAARTGSGAHTRSSQLGMRELYAEIGAALRLSEWQVARKVSLAWTLTDRFPQTLYEAGDGRLSPEHATLIAENGTVIDDDTVRAEFEAVALDMAREMTAAQLKAALSGLVVRLDPEGTEQRVREAVARRKVSLREVEPGLSRLTVDVPTAQGVGAYNRVREIAEELVAQNAEEKAAGEAGRAGDRAGDAARRSGTSDATTTGRPAGEAGETGDETSDTAGGSGDQTTGETGEAVDGTAGQATAGPVFDERTVPQVMADAVCDLLLTGGLSAHGATDDARDTLSAIRATVHVTIPAPTLAGATIGGATVEGGGPIDEDTARRLAGTAPRWIRLFTDPATGVPTCVDRYRPTKKQRLFLQTRDQRCRFPGCRRPARRCDIDHTVAYAEGGPTCLCNLEHLCERHHTVKHDTAWHIEQLPGGILRFTAPTGRTHTARPPGTVRFDPLTLITPDPHLTHQYARDPAPF